LAVRVRLTRVGGRKNPIWRVVVADQRSPRDGRVIETVGRYNAQRDPSEIVLDTERLRHWLARGAQPSAAVRSLMRAVASNGEQPRAEVGGGSGAQAEPPSARDRDASPGQQEGAGAAAEGG
jgi:small subunit ribosomal protein S16